MLSRQELADAVNAQLYSGTARKFGLDGSYVGKLEQGVIRWPNAAYRRAFRAVLGVATDSEIGFYNMRAGDFDDGGFEAMPVPGGVVDAVEVPAVAATRVGGPTEHPASALTLTVTPCAVGGVRIVIETPPTYPAVPGGGSGDAVRGADAVVYSLAHARVARGRGA